MASVLTASIKAHRARREAVGRSLVLSKASSSSSPMSVMTGGYPSFMELAYGTTLARQSEQFRHYCGWSYTAINCIARRLAGQKVKMGRKAEAAAEISTWAWDRPPGRKIPFHTRLKAPEFVKSIDSDIEVIETHPLLDAVQNPNPIMTSWDLLFFTVAGLEITGLAYWWITDDTGDGEDRMQIWPLPSDWVTPKHGKTLFESYVIQPPGQFGVKVEVDASEIVRFPLIDPANPLGTVSPMQAQAPAIAVDEEIQVAQHRAMKNDVIPGLVFRVGRLPSMTGIGEGPRPVLTTEQRRELYDTIRVTHQGVVNFRMPLIIDGMIEGVDRVTYAPAELDFLNSGNAVKSRIFQSYGVNPIVAGEIAGVNRAQAAVADSIFLRGVCNPIAEMIGQKMTQHIGKKDVFFWLEMLEADDPELKLRQMTEASRLKTESGKGLVTKNEWRAQILGLPPTDDGEETVSSSPAPPPNPFGVGFPGQTPGGPPKLGEKPGDEDEDGKPRGKLLPPKPGGEGSGAGNDTGNIEAAEESSKSAIRQVKFDSNQPREPAGSPEGGQWAGGEGSGGGSGGRMGDTSRSSRPFADPSIKREFNPKTLPINALTSSTSKISDDSKEALKWWTSADTQFSKINRALWSDKPMPAKLQSLHNRIVKGIEEARPVAEGTVAYRGITLKSTRARDELVKQFEKSAASGEPVTMKGFTATSLDPELSRSLYAGERWKAVMFEIRPKNGVYLSPISTVPSEQELLMKPGAKFRVAGVQKSVLVGWQTVQGTGHILIQLEEV